MSPLLSCSLSLTLHVLVIIGFGTLTCSRENCSLSVNTFWMQKFYFFFFVYLEWNFYHSSQTCNSDSPPKGIYKICSLDFLPTWKPPRWSIPEIDLLGWLIISLLISQSWIKPVRFSAELLKQNQLMCLTKSTPSLRKKLNNPLIHFKYHRTASDSCSSITTVEPRNTYDSRRRAPVKTKIHI